MPFLKKLKKKTEGAAKKGLRERMTPDDPERRIYYERTRATLEKIMTFMHA